MYQIWEFLKYTVVALFGLIYIMFTSCTGMPEPFHQDTADISMIELIDHIDSSQSLIHTVSSQKNIEGFMTDLCKLRCFKRFEPETSISDYGIYEIRIYYTDFAEYDVFIIGSRSDGRIQNGEEYNYGTYWYKEEDLEKLFEKYAYSADRHFVHEQQTLT